jgi:hypothetical protein
MVDTGLNLRHFDEVIDAADRQSPGSTAKTRAEYEKKYGKPK